MKFFIDTADVKEIKEAAAMGLVDGVTTNPSLVAKSGRKFREVLLEICDIVKGPVSGEVVATDFAGMTDSSRGPRSSAQLQSPARQTAASQITSELFPSPRGTSRAPSP